MVRATAKLSSVASSTATTAVTASPVWISVSDSSCSVRDRRMSATGPLVAPAISGRGSTAYSSRPRVAADTPVERKRSARTASSLLGNVEARTRPSMPNATSLPVISLRFAASESFSRKPALSVPRICGCVRNTLIGTVTTCRMPFGCGRRLTVSLPASAFLTAGWPASRRAAADASPDVASTSPLAFVTSSRLAE